jgi:hypothetical protein
MRAQSTCTQARLLHAHTCCGRHGRWHAQRCFLPYLLPTISTCIHARASAPACAYWPRPCAYLVSTLKTADPRCASQRALLLPHRAASKPSSHEQAKKAQTLLSYRTSAVWCYQSSARDRGSGGGYSRNTAPPRAATDDAPEGQTPQAGTRHFVSCRSPVQQVLACRQGGLTSSMPLASSQVLIYQRVYHQGSSLMSRRRACQQQQQQQEGLDLDVLSTHASHGQPAVWHAHPHGEWSHTALCTSSQPCYNNTTTITACPQWFPSYSVPGVCCRW